MSNRSETDDRIDIFVTGALTVLLGLGVGMLVSEVQKSPPQQASPRIVIRVQAEKPQESNDPADDAWSATGAILFLSFLLIIVGAITGAAMFQLSFGHVLALGLIFGLMPTFLLAIGYLILSYKNWIQHWCIRETLGVLCILIGVGALLWPPFHDNVLTEPKYQTTSSYQSNVYRSQSRTCYVDQMLKGTTVPLSNVKSSNPSDSNWVHIELATPQMVSVPANAAYLATTDGATYYAGQRTKSPIRGFVLVYAHSPCW